VPVHMAKRKGADRNRLTDKASHESIANEPPMENATWGLSILFSLG
jgi:hypothetical protein